MSIAIQENEQTNEMLGYLHTLLVPGADWYFRRHRIRPFSSHSS
jgi:hypothetical protein